MALEITLFEKGYLAGGVSLVYNSSNQTTYKMKYGQQLQNSDTDVLLHVPDQGETQPVRAIDLDRMFYFELNVEAGGDNDEVINAVTRLLRWVDGANQPALRYHMLNDAVELRLRVKLNGATNYTESSVKWGFVDAGSAWFSEPAGVNDMAYGVVVALHLPPYSEGAMITLHNDLINGDFAVESSTSGLGQAWVNLNTTTLTLDTDIYLVNGVSQKAVCDASTDHGIQSSAVTIPISTAIVAFGWVYLASGDKITMVLKDGSGTNIDTAATDEAGLKSIVDRNGNTWVRLECSGTNSGAANAFIQFRRTSTDATQATTFYVDAAYLQFGTSTIPSGGWVSTSALDSRGDETNAAMGRRNWLDFALIPGDADAIVRQDVNFKATNSKHEIIVGKVFDGKALAINQTLWIESDEFGATYGTQTNGSWSTGTGTSDNHYYRFTASGGTGNGARYAGFDGTDVRALLRTPRRVFIRVRASSVNARITFYTVGPSAERALSIGVTAGNTWELHDLGALVGNHILPDETESPDPTNYPIMFFVVAVSAVPNGGTVDIDCLWLPHTEEYMVVSSESTITNDTNFWIDGYQQGVIYGSNGQLEPERAGTAWYAKPGPTVTRFSMLMRNNANLSDLDDAYDIISYVWPRTRQLLGTA